jgi:CheY-like chemotaxis protein
MSHTLLLADDSAAIHRVIELTFADEPIDVVAVADGTAAVARIEAQPPDIVLADVSMPGLDGYQVCSRIKDTPRLAGIPVVLLTGAFEPVDESRARAARSDAVLAKPFDPQLVIRCVRELLERRPAAGAMPPVANAAPVPPRVPAAPAPPGAAAPRDAAAPGSASTPPPSLDDYFERLDASLSALASSGPPSSADTGPDDLGAWDAEPVGDPDSFDLPDLGATFASPEPAAGTSPFTVSGTRPSGEGEGEAMAGARAMAEAFATLLDAERRSGGPLAPAAAVDDRVIDEIVTRVLRRLADQGVREIVGDIVSEVAEHAIREEIARLKALL